MKKLVSTIIAVILLMVSSSVVFATELPFVPDGTTQTSVEETTTSSGNTSETTPVATASETQASNVPGASLPSATTTNSNSNATVTTATNAFMGADGEVVYIEEEVGDSVEDMNSTLETVTSSDASLVSDDASSAVVTTTPVDNDASSSNGISMFVAVMAVFVITPVLYFVFYNRKNK